ncbi:M-phase phosphoprotein 6 [Maniola jurtina]|uniref:M-phase phosphoprotein 6 n=1 Tax=Maniola jurtina TaxID=191418 RepID=UPI001E68C67E|nr:M-phase phosphoprotein 6 [Maniola jurtina]
MAARKKLQLPKSVLDMKFMKKTKERLEKELENTLGHEDLYSNIITNEMRHATGNFISESSFIFCEDLIEGRLSFKGMNPEIERLMESENKQNDCEGEMQKDISDEILAKKMNSFNKRKRPSSPSKYNVPKKRK